MDDFGSLYDALFGGEDNVFGDVADVFADSPLDDAVPEKALEAPPPGAGIIGSVRDTFAESPLDDRSGSEQRIAEENVLRQQVKNEFDKGADSFKRWYESLDNSTKMQVGGVLKGLATAYLTSSKQRQEIEAFNSQQNQKREDAIRRGYVPPDAVGKFSQSPLAGGFIQSARGA